MKITDRWILGTDDKCNFIIIDQYASSHHCEIIRTDGNEFYVRDLGSTNGTRVRTASLQEKKVTGWLRFYPGQTLIVGRTQIPWDKDKFS
jgi:pSer/pThr/pTyr-binding forkhead associated (FHA) protein